MRDSGLSRAPDYTKACIVMFGVNITWIFVAIWAIWGLIVVILMGGVINHMMTRLHERAVARAAEHRRNPRPRARS